MIVAICITEKHGAQPKMVNTIKLISGLGIVGDAHFKQKQHSGQNITFIQSEVINFYNTTYKQNIGLIAAKRNVITRNIELNSLVGKEFLIGEVKFKGVRLCEPCNYFAKSLVTTITKFEVMKAFLHKGGLRADVVSSGKIAIGMTFSFIG